MTLCETAERQASLSITNSQSFLKLMSIKSVMPSNHLLFCCPLLLLPSIFPSIRVFSNESVLCIRWPKCWSFSFRISPLCIYKFPYFDCTGSFCWVHGLSCPKSCGTGWLVSWSGIELRSRALEGRFLTTGLPGKPRGIFFLDKN